MRPEALLREMLGDSKKNGRALSWGPFTGYFLLSPVEPVPASAVCPLQQDGRLRKVGGNWEATHAGREWAVAEMSFGATGG